MVDAIKKRESMNTTQILLYLNKTLFSKEPEKLSDNNRILRLYTFLDSRAATELGSMIKQLPDIFRIQEKAETGINKFRAAKTDGAIKAFNLFVDDIQEPTTKAAKYTQQFVDLKKAFSDFIGDLSKSMAVALPKSLTDEKTGPYLEELRKHDRYKPLATIAKSLDTEGTHLQTQFEKLIEKAKITLAAVAPEVVLAEKNKAAQSQKPSEPPSTLSNE